MTAFKFKPSSFIINNSECSFSNFEHPGLHHLDSSCLFISALRPSLVIYQYLLFVVVAPSGSDSDDSKVLQIFTVSFHEQGTKKELSRRGEKVNVEEAMGWTDRRTTPFGPLNPISLFFCCLLALDWTWLRKN